jgi:hypothetical protein
MPEAVVSMLGNRGVATMEDVLQNKTVRSTGFHTYGQNQRILLDVSDLEQGIYILNVISEKGYRKAEKFIKD